MGDRGEDAGERRFHKRRGVCVCVLVAESQSQNEPDLDILCANFVVGFNTVGFG